MTTPAPARLFISYATKDGAAFAAMLRRNLEAKGFSIWQDIIALQGDADWWSQIENALRSKELQHFLLVVTPRALESPVVRREIRLARQEGKTVSSVRGPGVNDMSTLPRWLGNLYDLDVPERQTNLLRLLELRSAAKRVPMMAPEPPVDFVARPTEFQALRKQLLDSKGDAVAITAALRGAGGYGKTTLAKALAHDPDIQDAYFDGILWVELGEHGGAKVLTLISDLVALITGSAVAMNSVEAARTALAEALGDRRILLVVDDVWQKHHLDPFLHGGKRTTRLVTTRFDSVLPEKAARQVVDAMTAGEALTLIGWDLPKDQVAAQAKLLADLAQYLGEWAQLVKLANGFLRDRVLKHRQPLGRAIADLRKRFEARGLDALSANADISYADRHHSVAKVISTTLELLDPDKRARFGELGIFPEDADIPVGIVARLWAETGGLDVFAAEDLLTELYGLSLLLALDLDRRTMRFHDTTRHFLQDAAKRGGQLASHHKRLMHAIGDMGGTTEAPPADSDYFYRYLPHHLAEAGDRATLDALLLDPGWLQAKLDATKSPQDLVADYEQHGQGPMQNLIGRTLRLTSGICVRDQRQLLPQLLGRLIGCTDAAAPAFLDRARHLIKPPALLTQSPSLTPPGAEVARLEGHAHWVNALAVLPDGRLASGSVDGTIRLWDASSGVETARLAGTVRVQALAVLPDGRLASGSVDGTVRLWDVASGAEMARLAGHTDSVNALAVLPDGRLASGSDDRTIRLWDAGSGAETARLAGHTDRVNALAVLRDGRLVSGSKDGTIRLWEPGSASGAGAANGAETARLAGQGDRVTALAVLPDNRLASSTLDEAIRLWDAGSGAETARLAGHNDTVNALAVLADGRLASGSYDGTIRLWETSSGAETACLAGHTGPVFALAALPDGRLASGSMDNTIRLWEPGSLFGAGAASGAETASITGYDRSVNALAVLRDGCLAAAGPYDPTIRLWDAVSGAETASLAGEGSWVNALAVLRDGRLAAASYDGTIRLWDASSGAETALLAGHGGEVHALAALPDGRLASGAKDRKVRLWDAGRCVETASFAGHSGPVFALAVLPDGRLASGSDDGTIRLWDVASGWLRRALRRADTARLAGHTGPVLALAVLPDGRLASGSDDGTIRLWDASSGAETARLAGHGGEVHALAVLPDGRLASGSDDRTIRLWDLKNAWEISRLEVDAPVLSLCVPPRDRWSRLPTYCRRPDRPLALARDLGVIEVTVDMLSASDDVWPD